METHNEVIDVIAQSQTLEMRGLSIQSTVLHSTLTVRMSSVF